VAWRSSVVFGVRGQRPPDSSRAAIRDGVVELVVRWEVGVEEPGVVDMVWLPGAGEEEFMLPKGPFPAISLYYEHCQNVLQLTCGHSVAFSSPPMLDSLLQ